MTYHEGTDMPRELHSADQFQKLTPKALELRVVRTGESVKLKLRTPEYLFTYKTSDDEAGDLLKNVKDLEVIEIAGTPEKKEEKPKEKSPSK
ncbi:MAG: hypothetical protein JRN15_15745 [Nitrososphaerota archaeon]|nr:hypothetical protein [Nitrososphaerota archaeon]